MVEDLLRGFIGERWIEDLDFSTLERKNGSYVSDDLSEREDDIIWRIKWMGQERWMYIYFLIEFQTEHDCFMSVRILSYVSLLYQDLIKTGEIKTGDRLPPVLPMVIYRGEAPWRTPLDIRELIQEPPPGLSRYLPSLRYLLLEEVRMNETELMKMSNLVAEVFRIELSETLKASIPPFVSFLKWTERAGPEQDHLKRAVFAWYKRAQMPAKLIDDDDVAEEMVLEEIEPMLSERVAEWTKALRAEGKAEGLAEGKAAVLHAVAVRLLTSGMDAAKVAEVTDLPISEVLTIRAEPSP
jgi:predicted transposase/invertase (TIGR01784 family)